MDASVTLHRGRKAFRQQAWAEAYHFLASADRETPLECEDLEHLAKAASLLGKEPETTTFWTRAHQEFLKRENLPKAAYCAFWLGMLLFNQGEGAQANGWMSRARRLLDDSQKDCAEQGLLLVPEALQCMRTGDNSKAQSLFDRALKIGKQFNDPDVMTLGHLGCGQALVLQNKIAAGTTRFDEAMIAVVAGEVSPIVAGLVYCAVIETCQKIYDLRRAREWTSALSRWCDSQPDLVLYRGQCLIRRAEVMQLHGEWSDAITEIQRACDLLSEPAAGEAFYRQAEIYRLKGEFTTAMAMYRQASKWGRNPQPGLALLRLAQDKLDVAEAAIRQSEKEKQDPIARLALLPAFVEIMIVVDGLAAAQTGADEFTKIAAGFHSPFLQAVSEQIRGSVLLAEGEPRAALEKLRLAETAFTNLGASYESARTQVLIGEASRELSDEDTAQIELEAARATFQQLGAKPDLKKVDALFNGATQAGVQGLTLREQEVLQLVATGKTNKELAVKLHISERTVDRHVSNILSKLGVNSRAAATAFAYENHLL